MNNHTLRMWLIRENDRSILVASAASLPKREIWLPRSLIDRLSKQPQEPNAYQPIEFTLPEWKVDLMNLWEWVL